MQVSGADSRCIAIARQVNRIIMKNDCINAISEITISEYQSNLFDWVRDDSKPDFDLGKADDCSNQLMRWIDEGRIEVLGQPPKLIEKALAYVRTAAAEKACSFRAWDAVHLFQACDWAKTIGAVVNIITNDRAFYRYINAFPEFSAHVRLYNPETGRYHP